MKKTLFWIFTAVLMLFSLAGKGQEYEFKPGSDLSLSIGAYPLDAYNNGFKNFYYQEPTLRDLYGIGRIRQGDAFISGAINLTYTYKFHKWFELSAYLIYSGYYTDYYNAYSPERLFSSSVHSIGAMPFARFVYLNRKYVKLYSGIGIGLALQVTKAGSQTGVCVNPAFSLNIFGVRVGTKVYGFADLSIGSAGLISAGIGVKLN